MGSDKPLFHKVHVFGENVKRIVVFFSPGFSNSEHRTIHSICDNLLILSSWMQSINFKNTQKDSRLREIPSDMVICLCSPCFSP